MTDKTLQSNQVFEIRRVVSDQSDGVVTKEQAIIKKVGCDKIVLKTTYTGAQGPKGDTAEFNDLIINDLAAIFRSRLV